MKKDIHPNLNPVTFVDVSTGKKFNTFSTVSSKKTETVDGVITTFFTGTLRWILIQLSLGRNVLWTPLDGWKNSSPSFPVSARNFSFSFRLGILGQLKIPWRIILCRKKRDTFQLAHRLFYLLPLLLFAEWTCAYMDQCWRSYFADTIHWILCWQSDHQDGKPWIYSSSFPVLPGRSELW